MQNNMEWVKECGQKYFLHQSHLKTTDTKIFSFSDQKMDDLSGILY